MAALEKAVEEMADRAEIDVPRDGGWGHRPLS